MSQPFSGMPNPESPRPFKRRSQPAVIQEAVEKALRKARDRMRPVLDRARRESRAGLWLAQRHAQNLWTKGKRNPRTVGLIAGALVLTVGGGAYALSASSTGRSLCPPSSESRFLLLMDWVPNPAARAEMEIHYDVCGLPSGTPYRAKVRLSQQQSVGKKKKKSAPPKPLVVTIKDKVDGPATRRQQELNLGSMKPGTYILELSVVDDQGRERKRQQKVLVRAK